MKFIYTLTILFLYNLNLFGIEKIDQEQTLTIKDSVLVWIDSSKNKNFDFKKRKRYLDKAYRIFNEDSKYSSRIDYLSQISFAYYRLNDSLSFRKVNKHALNLSLKLKDSSNLADNYWDLGNFYSKNGVKDSAYFMYFNAQKMYEAIDNRFYSGRMLLNMAIIQSDIKDYVGSEITTTKAIKVLKPFKKYRHLYRCYNNLGINFNELNEFDKALFYHNKALEYEEKIKRENTYRANTLNNIGVSYEMQKKYKEAIKHYILALKEENLKNNNINLYAKIIDNLAYSKFKLNDMINTEMLFHKSLKIRDSIHDHLGLAINKLHLAEFYAYKRDTIKALNFANETKQLAAETKNFRELLPTLLLLTKLDKKNYASYTNQYIKLNDSLLKEERAIRNKFARIRFETDEFIDKNRRLNHQRKIIIAIAILVALIGLLLYVIRNQKAKNKELQFEKNQQRANEEIYKLMITQQNKLDEGSKKEKERISQELHDGVLGKLFGTRLILGTLNDKKNQDTIHQREKYIDELQEIEEEIRNISHELHKESKLKNIGYPKMIESLLEEQSRVTNFDYKFTYAKNINWENMDGALKMNFYRIIQEAIQNINKYSKATKVTIEFKIENNLILLTIVDNGVGFDVNVKEKNGIGLNNMKTRLKSFKGRLIIKSKSQNGTSIIVKVPYKENDLTI